MTPCFQASFFPLFFYLNWQNPIPEHQVWVHHCSSSNPSKCHPMLAFSNFSNKFSYSYWAYSFGKYISYLVFKRSSWAILWKSIFIGFNPKSQITGVLNFELHLNIPVINNIYIALWGMETNSFKMLPRFWADVKKFQYFICSQLDLYFIFLLSEKQLSLIHKV